MKDFNLGKKLYRSTALPHIKIGILTIALWIFVNLYFKTFSDPDFIKLGGEGIYGILRFHYRYPAQIVGYILMTLVPATYYAFFRGINFFEDGLVANKGLPFFNQSIQYSNISSFKIIHQKYIMSITRTDIEDELLFTIRDADRAIAILDQHNIKGDLGQESSELVAPIRRKVIIGFIIFGIAVSIMQYTGLIIKVNQLLFR